MSAIQTIIDGRYAIGRPLGGGGMAEVFLGLHVVTGCQVALKCLRPEWLGNTDLRRRFRREGEFLMELEHPHVVRAVEVIERDDILVIVLEHVDGGSLGEWLVRRDRPFGTIEVRALAASILDALAAIHARGVVHRDVKPANVLIRTLPEGRYAAVLSDFGIAKFTGHLDTADPRNATQAGMGTPDYCSPEQRRNSADVDARADVYCMGILLVELLTLRNPFAFTDAPSAPRREGSYELPPGLRQADPGLARVIEKALCFDRAGRFRDGGEMRAALDPGQRERWTVVEQPASPALRPPAHASAARDGRLPRMAAPITALFLAVTLISFAVAWGVGEMTPTKNAPERSRQSLEPEVAAPVVRAASTEFRAAVPAVALAVTAPTESCGGLARGEYAGEWRGRKLRITVPRCIAGGEGKGGVAVEDVTWIWGIVTARVDAKAVTLHLSIEGNPADSALLEGHLTEKGLAGADWQLEWKGYSPSEASSSRSSATR